MTVKGETGSGSKIQDLVDRKDWRSVGGSEFREKGAERVKALKGSLELFFYPNDGTTPRRRQVFR
jgi:hypothetical protein